MFDVAWPRRCICLGLIALSAGNTWAASLEPSAEKLVLNPPYAEIPPSLWEQYGAWLIAGAFLLLALTVVAIAWKLRPKPQVMVPIEVRTRQELELLRQRPEDGQTLSLISRSLKRYLTVAFELSREEMTTAEFSRALGDNGRIGRELAAQASEFLRRCDQLKFAPDPSQSESGWIDQAFTIFESGETRRAVLKAANVAKPPVIK
jgi:hypothetical protein